MIKNQRIQVPNFQRATNQMEQLYGRTLPVKIASLAEGFFKESFRNQGFSDNGLQPWRRTKSGKLNQFGKPSQGILIGTGKLKRSIRTLQKSEGVVHIAAGDQHVPYAQIHNEGGSIKKTVNVRSHRRKRTSSLKVNFSSIKTRKSGSRRAMVVTGYSAVRAHSRRMNLSMPKRQFMGQSRMLMEETERIIIREISALERQLFTV